MLNGCWNLVIMRTKKRILCNAQRHLHSVCNSRELQLKWSQRWWIAIKKNMLIGIDNCYGLKFEADTKCWKNDIFGSNLSLRNSMWIKMSPWIRTYLLYMYNNKNVNNATQCYANIQYLWLNISVHL